MTERARIIVGIDGSDTSRVALRWAWAEAQLRQSVLDVLHAWHTPLVFVPDTYDPGLVEMDRMKDAALRFIEHELEVAGVRNDGAVEIETSQANHFPARALVEASQRAALVVVGRHGLGGFPHELTTPKVVQVAHHAACPVAVVPDAWSGGGHGVVVGIDGSEHSATAARWAAEEARVRSVPLTAVMAWGLLDQHHAGDETTFDPTYSAADATAALDLYLASALGDASKNVIRRVVNDLPAPALLENAARAEMLVVGARGLGGFAGLLLGSVSHRCLAVSACPTVVVR